MSISWLFLPKEWLVHFAATMPCASVNRLMLICKRFRKHLLHNVSWRSQCESLPAYGELAQTEVESIQVDGFWYRWYLSRCIRAIPFKKAVRVKMKQSNRKDDVIDVWIPVAGSLLFDSSTHLLVVIEAKKGSKLNPDVKTTFLTVRVLAYNRESHISYFSRCDAYWVTLRDNGNYSIPMWLCREFD